MLQKSLFLCKTSSEPSKLMVVNKRRAAFFPKAPVSWDEASTVPWAACSSA